MLWAFHPVSVESVAWITERKNVLSGLFYFLAVLAYLRFRPLTGPDAARACDWRYYPLVLVLFLCALLSKTVTCSLPAVLLLLVWWKTGRVRWRDVLVLAPLFVMGVASGFMTTWMEKHYVGASGAEWALSFVQRCLVAGRALWFYAGKLFWPRDFTFIYPRWDIDTGVPWQYLFPVAALVVLIALWLLRSRIGRGPLVAVLYFAGTLAPALGFFDVYPFRFSYVADHFQYLACIGLISLAASTGAAICERAGQRGRDWGVVTAAIVLLVLGLTTWRQQHIYRDLETLWRDTLAKNPDCWLAHNNLGNILVMRGETDKARAEFAEAIRLKPNFTYAHENLAKLLAESGRTAEAIPEYEAALKTNPHSAEDHDNLGVALASLGRFDEAIAQYRSTLQIDPKLSDVHYNLAVALVEEGKMPEAITEYQAVIRIKPDPVTYNNLAVTLLRVGRVQEAVEQFQRALALQPDDPGLHYNFGNALAQQGKIPEAIASYEQALKLRPDFTAAKEALARLQARQ